ncbi:uncharacterized protein Tco_0255418 [Tanacetum coccineum]
MDIQLQISKVFKRFPGKHPDIAKKNPKPNRKIELNWSKRSIFWDLEYWPFLLLKNNLDVMHIEKNALEALLNTLLQNDKSKDTLKARQDLETLIVRKELWLVKKPNGKFEKPHPKYSFTPENRKRFCKFIKGVRLPDGFGSNFKQKVTADHDNITGMKSHDCHIMMHRLLPYGVQRYLPKNIAAPIIELCLFFKQLCARSLMQQDMAKAKKQSISIMIELEQIFPPAFFDIMIHVAIHLPDEAILGGPLRYRWMFPFERYMKKLKNYVRNKAKPEGSIAEGYVAEEALTFCSRYLKDDVETRFNRLGRNDDGLPEEEPDKFQVFRSVCKPTGRMKETRLTINVMHAVVWFVLNNSPEVDADILAYKEESPDNVETSFPAWFNYKMMMSMHMSFDDDRCSVSDDDEVNLWRAYFPDHTEGGEMPLVVHLDGPSRHSAKSSQPAYQTGNGVSLRMGRLVKMATNFDDPALIRRSRIKVVVGPINVYTVGDRVKAWAALKLRIFGAQQNKQRIKADHFTRYESSECSANRAKRHDSNPSRKEEIIRAKAGKNIPERSLRGLLDLRRRTRGETGEFKTPKKLRDTKAMQDRLEPAHPYKSDQDILGRKQAAVSSGISRCYSRGGDGTDIEAKRSRGRVVKKATPAEVQNGHYLAALKADTVDLANSGFDET